MITDWDIPFDVTDFSHGGKGSSSHPVALQSYSHHLLLVYVTVDMYDDPVGL